MGTREDLTRLIDAGPDPASPTRYGAGARLLRRLVLRLLRHYQEHERAVNRSIVARLDATDQQYAALATRLDDVLQRAQGSAEVLSRMSARVSACESSLHALGVALAQLQQEQEAQSTIMDNMASGLARAGFPGHAGDAGTRPDLEQWSSALRGRWERRAHRQTPLPGSLSVRLDTEVGELLYPADDEVVTPWVASHGSWEHDECRVWRSILRPGMTFVDVGAHVGYFTLMGARCVGPAGYGIALEPAPENFALLCANLLRSGVTNVEPVNAAAWRRRGHLHLKPSAENSGDHRVAESPGDGSLGVAALALDDIIPAAAEVHAVKVDTQGRDHVVIEGMNGLVSRQRPVILVEFWPEGILDLGDDPEDVIDFYRSLELRIELLGNPGGDGSPNGAVVEWALSCPGGYGTFVLSPMERAPILSPEGAAGPAPTRA